MASNGRVGGRLLYIADIEESVSRIAAAPFASDNFPFDFIAAFDAPPATITRIRNGTQNASDIEGGVLWRLKLHLLVCPPGEVEDALARLQRSTATTRQTAKPTTTVKISLNQKTGCES